MSAGRITLDDLNRASHDEFVRIAGPAFEHSPWIALRAADRRPFPSVSDLHAAMCDVVRSSTVEEQLRLIRAHPDLVGRLAQENRLTMQSTREQSAAGLTQLTADEIATFESHNGAYREKFGFPFVICARENKKEAILAAFPRRLANSPDQEIATALTEIEKIARFRLVDIVTENPPS